MSDTLTQSIIPDIEYGGTIVPFAWTVQSRTAALCLAGVLLAPRDRSVVRIAAIIGVSAPTIGHWRRHPEFSAVVDAYRTKASDAILRSGVADKTARIQALVQRHDLLNEVIESRQQWAADNAVNGNIFNSDDPDEGTSAVPGIETGLLHLKYKTVGTGPLQRIVIEHSIDTQLLSELRSIERAIAEEKGERNPENSINLDLKLYAGVDLDKV